MIIKRLLIFALGLNIILSSIIIPDSAEGEFASSNISTQSVFSPLLNIEKKDIALLEYIFEAAVLSGKLDPMIEDKVRTNTFYDVDLSSEEIAVSFCFDKSDKSTENNIRLILCSLSRNFVTTDYWCAVQKISEEEVFFQFFTEKEKNDQKFFKQLKRMRYFNRIERTAINRAKDSELLHDEKIRNAIKTNDFKTLVLDTESSEMIFIVYNFLQELGCSNLLYDFSRIIKNGQLLIILGSTPETTIDTPHAGGRGIYLPNDEKYINSDTIVHELFAKAGLKHSENEKLQSLCKAFIAGGMKLPDTTNKEKILLNRIKDVTFLPDMTEIIDYRDYSSEKKDRSSFLKRMVNKIGNMIKERDKKNYVLDLDYYDEILMRKGLETDFIIDKIARVISEEFSKMPNPNYSEILERMGIALKADRLVMYMFSNDKKELTRRATWGNPLFLLGETMFPEKIKTEELAWSFRELKKNSILIMDKLGMFPYKAKKDKNFFEKNISGSFMMVPIRSKNEEILGVIVVDKVEETRKWNLKDENTIKVVAAAISDTIDREKGRELLEAKKLETEKLLTISTIINEVQDMDTFLEEILDLLCLDEAIDCGGVYLFNEYGVLKLKTAVGISPEFREVTEYYLPGSFQQEFMNRGEARFISYLDFLQEDKKDKFSDMRRKENIKSVVIIPLFHDGVVFGGLNLASKKYYEMDKKIKAILIGVAKQMSEGISRRIVTNNLREEQEFLKLAIDGANEAIWKLNIKTKAFTYRENVVKLLGYNLGERIPNFESWFNMVHDEDREGLKKVVQDCIDGKTEVFLHEYRMKTKSGEWKWFKNKGKVYKDLETGETINITGTLLDVDARHRAEDALKEKGIYYKRVLNEAPIGIAIVDSEGYITFNNPSFSQMLLPNSYFDFIGKSIIDLLNINIMKTGWILNGDAVSYNKKLDQNKIAEQLGLKEENGENIFVECKITPLQGQGGDSLEYLIHLQDITKLKKYELELKVAYQKLKEQAEEFIKTRISLATNEIATEWAHEINNPTANVIFLADTIFEKIEDEEDISTGEYVRVIQLIRRETERISNITSRILGVARSTSLGKIPCSIEQILTDIVILKQKKLKNLGVELELDFNETPSIIIANKGRLQQAFDNIIKNAVSFMENTKVKKLTIKTELIKAGTPSAAVKVSFKDTGPGLKPENINEIWETLKTLRADNRGNGIGLSEVKAVADEHGGKVGVESVYGEGATFSMVFPMIQSDDSFVEEFIGNADGRMFQKLWHDYNNRISILFYLWEEKSYLPDGQIPENLMALYKRCYLAGQEIQALVKEAQLLNNVISQDQKKVKTLIGASPDILKDIFTFELGDKIETEFMQSATLLGNYMSTFQEFILNDSELGRLGMTRSYYIRERTEEKAKTIADETKLFKQFFDIFVSTEVTLENSVKFEYLKKEIINQNLSISRIIAEVDFLLEKEVRLQRLEKIYGILDEVKAVLMLLKEENLEGSSNDAQFLKMAMDSVLTGLMEKRKVYVENEIAEVLNLYGQEKGLFFKHDVTIGETQVLSGYNEEFIITGERMRFIGVIDELLKVGLTEDKFLEKNENSEKKSTLRIEKDRQSGEIIISMVSNYFQFKKEFLAKVEVSSGRELQKVLAWSRGKNNALAKINKMLESFAGRMSVENIENKSIIRLFIPSIDSNDIKAGKIVAKKDTVFEDMYEEKFTRFPEIHFEGRPNIVIAEDEVSQRMGMKGFLEKEKINVYSARSVKEAYELILEMEINGISIDMGIFDITMPSDVEREMNNGLDLAETLKDTGYIFPVIITTGQAISSGDKFGFEPELRSNGVFQACLSKPLDKSELKTVMKDLLGGKLEKAMAKQTTSIKLSELSKKVILVYGREQADFERILLRTGVSKKENTIIYVLDRESLEKELAKGGIDFIIDTTGGDVAKILIQIYENLSMAPPIFDFLNEETDQIELMNTLASIGA